MKDNLPMQCKQRRIIVL